MIYKIALIVIVQYCINLQGTEISVSSPRTDNATGVLEEVQEVKENRSLLHFKDEQDDFIKRLQKLKAELLYVNGCDCSLNDESINADILDCSKTETSEWNPPHHLMPEKSKSFRYFYLKMPTESNMSWCPSDNFTSIIVSTSTRNLNVTKSLKILDENGTLEIVDGQFGLSPVHINKSSYCVIRRREQITFNICMQEPPIANISNFVQKCCGHNQIMHGDNPKNCITVTNQTRWFPIYYRGGNKLRLNNQFELTPTSPPNSPNLVIGFPSCSSYIIRSFRDNKFPNLQENGDVVLVDEKKKKYTTIEAGKFCIDGIYIANPSPNKGPEMARGENQSLEEQNRHYVYNYSGSEWHQGIIVCMYDDKTVEPLSWMFPLYAAVNHTAALFLLLTTIVYILIWSHHNIHGWLQFSYAVSLFFAFSFLAIVQVWTQVFSENWPKLCYNLGWLIHFSILSSFFWLSSMNFDIWWRFSGRRVMWRIRSKPCRENVKKFVFFASFSVGIPILITSLTVGVDRWYMDISDDDFWLEFLPRFGVNKCYFTSPKSSFPFLYFPIGLLLFGNLLFFSSTVVQLRKIHSSTELAKSHSTSEDKKGVRLIAKLFIVMGVLWTFEFLSFAASLAFPNSEKLLIWIFMPTEIINSMQGIAIFVIFICKPNVLSKLSAKFGSLKCR